MRLRLSNRTQVVILLMVGVALYFAISYVERAKHTFTLADYSQISFGMSEKEVTNILNKDSKLLYEKKRNDGVVVSAYMWTNPDGSFVEAKFENDRLRHTAERGLQNKDKQRR